MNTAQSIQLATVIITGTGVIIALFTLVWQSHITRQQMKLTFFADYTKRYQKIILHLPSNINDPDFKFGKLSTKEREKTLKYMRVYFDLCSEEFYLSQTKKIDKKVWKEWSSGIQYAFSKKAFQDGWKIINMDSQFYGDFVKWMNAEVLVDN